MKGRKATKSRKPLFSEPMRKYLELHATPLMLAGDFDNDNEYLGLYNDLFEKLFKEEADAGIYAMWKAIGNVDGACAVEAAARMAGFIVGFEYCRRLLTTPAQGGAR